MNTCANDCLQVLERGFGHSGASKLSFQYHDFLWMDSYRVAHSGSQGINSTASKIAGFLERFSSKCIQVVL